MSAGQGVRQGRPSWGTFLAGLAVALAASPAEAQEAVPAATVEQPAGRIGGEWTLRSILQSQSLVSPPVDDVPVLPAKAAVELPEGAAATGPLFDSARAFSFKLRGVEQRQVALQAKADEARNAFLPVVEAAWEKPLTSRISYSPDVTALSDSFPEERPSRVGVEARWVLFDGFQRINLLKAARKLSQAGQQAIVQTAQQVHLDAATAALAVMRDRRIVGLRQKGIEARRGLIAAMEKLFAERAVTLTDLADARRMLAEEEAALELARGDLEASETEFARVVGGAPPAGLSIAVPAGALPADAEAAAARALAGSPANAAASLVADAAWHEAEAKRAALLPKVELSASYGSEYDTSPQIDRTDDATVMLRVRVPLIDLRAAPQISGARAEARQKRYEAQDAARDIAMQARTLFERRAALTRQIGRFRAQVEEAGKAVKGMRIEREAGTRTVMDIAEAEGDLVQARIALAQAEFEHQRSAFQLLAVSGELQPQRLASR